MNAAHEAALVLAVSRQGGVVDGHTQDLVPDPGISIAASGTGVFSGEQ